MRGRQTAVVTASAREDKRRLEQILFLSIKLIIQRMCFKKGSQRLQKEC